MIVSARFALQVPDWRITAMATAQEIAVQLLPVFAGHVVARHKPKTYGYYARVIGRDPTKEAIAVGPAMHAIGAVCVVQQLPVAPLYWVVSAERERRQVFASDPLEAQHILEQGRYETMYVVAREYRYTMAEFAGLQHAMEMLTTGPYAKWTPHSFWHLAIVHKPQGENQTYLERAMLTYNALLQELKARRARGEA